MAKILRKQMTKEERRLWYDFLKSYPVSFNRQYVILNYVVDFFCPNASLAIEIDGSQHFEEQMMVSDWKRDNALESFGILVLRYTNLDIQRRFNSVCEDIDHHVKLRMSKR